MELFWKGGALWNFRVELSHLSPFHRGRLGKGHSERKWSTEWHRVQWGRVARWICSGGEGVGYSRDNKVLLTSYQWVVSLHHVEMCTTNLLHWVLGYTKGCSTRVESMCSMTSRASSSGSSSRISDSSIRFAFWGIDHAALRNSLGGGWGRPWGICWLQREWLGWERWRVGVFRRLSICSTIFWSAGGFVGLFQ